MPAATRGRGDWAEDIACRHLSRAGLCAVDRNYRCRRGEIDLVMRDRDTLVFVEVRYRAREDFGGALESIDGAKEQRLQAAAAHYLSHRQRDPDAPCRFDVVCVSGSGERPSLQWIKDAFRT